MADDTESRWRGKFWPVRKQSGALEKREDTKPAVASRISRSPLFNRWEEKRIETAQDVVNAERNLMDALSEHTRAKHRLINIGTEIQADQAERLNRLRQAQADGNLMQLDVEIALAARQRELIKVQQALKEAQEGSDGSSGKYEQKLREAERKTEFEAEMKVVEAKRAFAIRERLRQERDEMKAAVLKAVKGEATAEQQRQLDDIEDFFQKLMDEVSP